MMMKRTLPLLPILPDEVRVLLAGRTIAPFALPRSVQLRIKKPEKIGGAEWATRYRVVTDGAHEGPWRHEYAPHTVKIMDTFTLPWVLEIWFCGVEQSGKTNTMINCMGWAIDCAPGNIFYLMPTEDTAAKITGGKLKPVIKRSPRLARYLTGRDDDLTLARLNLGNGVAIMPAHANSAASMASWAAKYCFGDEVDKYPAMAGKEADPITLIKKRNRTYRGRYKRFFASTPAGRFIYRGMQHCHQVWEMRVRCPDCGELVRMDAEHLHMPDGVTAENVELSSVGYACNACGVVWSERDRLDAIRGGAWVCVKGDDVVRPKKVGFHHRAWECLDIALSEIAAAYLKAKSGGTADRVSWANGYEAVDYVEEQVDREAAQIMRLVEPSMPRGVAPRDPCHLAMVVDTQQVGFYYQVWVYGWGRDLETWRIEHGYVEHFDHLLDIVGREWPDADGKKYRIGSAWIDSGGGTNPFNPKHSRTAEVYEFCRRNPLFRPIKGRREQAQPWNASRIDFFPSRDGRKIPIPGGIVLYTINVTLYKDELARKLLVEPGDPGAYHLHAEMGDDYVKHMCAEYKDERGWWHCPRHKDNHHWDIGVYGLAAADILGIKNMQMPGESSARRRVLSNGVING